jgi:hypothetical protein
MRNVFLATILAVSTTAIFAPSLPALAQDQQCIKGRGCVFASQRSYNACFAQVDSGQCRDLVRPPAPVLGDSQVP